MTQEGHHLHCIANNSWPCDENNLSGIVSSNGHELLVLELPEDSVEWDKKPIAMTVDGNGNLVDFFKLLA